MLLNFILPPEVGVRNISIILLYTQRLVDNNLLVLLLDFAIRLETAVVFFLGLLVAGRWFRGLENDRLVLVDFGVTAALVSHGGWL